MFVEKYLQDLRARRYRPAAVAEYVARCARTSMEAAWHRPKALAGVVVAGLGHLVCLLCLSVFLSFQVDRSLALDYFIATAWWLVGGLAWVTLHLGMFRSDEELPLSGLGLPNFITLGRLLSIPAFYLFITRDHHTLAMISFLVGGLSDIADGIAARRLNASTRMGRIFDPIVDVLFTCGIVLGLTRAGYLPEWILTLVLVRYGLLMLGATWIYVAHGPVAVRPTVLGKTTGVITMSLLVAVTVTMHFVPPSAQDQVLELLYSTLGFVLIITIVQVVIMGFYNMRHAGHVPEAHGALGVVLGKVSESEAAEEAPARKPGA